MKFASNGSVAIVIFGGDRRAFCVAGGIVAKLQPAIFLLKAGNDLW